MNISPFGLKKRDLRPSLNHSAWDYNSGVRLLLKSGAFFFLSLSVLSAAPRCHSPTEFQTQALSVAVNAMRVPYDLTASFRRWGWLSYPLTRGGRFGAYRTSGSGFEEAERNVQQILSEHRERLESEARARPPMFFSDVNLSVQIIDTPLPSPVPAFHFLHSQTGQLIVVLNSNRLQSQTQKEAAQYHEVWEHFYLSRMMSPTPLARRSAHRLASARENLKYVEADGLTARHKAEIRAMSLDALQNLIAEQEAGARRMEIESLLPRFMSASEAASALAYENRFIQAVRAQSAFRPVIQILEAATEGSPKLDNHEAQKQMAGHLLPLVKGWYRNHRQEIEDLQAHLSDPTGVKQYERNLIYRDPNSRFVILNHRFRGGTPVHFHGTEAEGYKMALTLPVEDGLSEVIFSGTKEEGQPWALLRSGRVHEAPAGHLDYLTMVRGTPHRIFNTRDDGKTVGIIEIYLPPPAAFERVIPLEEAPGRYYVIAISSLEFPYKLVDLVSMEGWSALTNSQATNALSSMVARNNPNDVVYRANETVTRPERAYLLFRETPHAELYFHEGSKRFLLKLPEDTPKEDPLRRLKSPSTPSTHPSILRAA